MVGLFIDLDSILFIVSYLKVSIVFGLFLALMGMMFVFMKLDSWIFMLGLFFGRAVCLAVDILERELGAIGVLKVALIWQNP